MSEPFTPSILQPGDAILYFRHTHIEIYRGEQKSFASREGIGVDAFPLQVDGIVAVLRPKQPLDFSSADHWFETHARGHRNNWLGLFHFEFVRRRGKKNKMSCSEFATLYYRSAGLVPFTPWWPADRVPPTFFLVSPAFEIIWTNRDWF